MIEKGGKNRGERTGPQECVEDAAHTCNLFCKYCQAPVNGKKADINETINRIKKRKIKAVNFVGNGEPTTNPELPALISGLRKSGVSHVMLSTNAVALSDMKLCSRICKDVDFFTVNFPSHIKEIYNSATRSLKYELVLLALENLKALKAENKIWFFHILFRENYAHLPDFVPWVKKKFPSSAFMNFAFVRNRGRTKDNKEIVPTYTETGPYLKIALAKAKISGLKTVVQNVPLCVLKNFEGFALEYHRWRRGDAVLEWGQEKKLRLNVCSGCSLEPACCGARPDYVRMYGAGELASSKIRPWAIKPEKF